MSAEEMAPEMTGEEEKPKLVEIKRENAIVQIVFGDVIEKIPLERFALSIAAEFPHGQGKQTVVEGSGRAFLELATWAGVEGIVERNTTLIAMHKRIYDRLWAQEVKIEVEPPRRGEIQEGAGEPSMILWGPEAGRLVRRREPFSVTPVGMRKRIRLSLVLEEIAKGAVLFYYSRMYYVLRTQDYGLLELSFSRPEPKRALIVSIDLEEEEVDRLSTWAKYAKISKQEVLRTLIRGLPRTTKSGQIAIAAGVFTEIPAKDRRRIDQLVGEWEKRAKASMVARSSAAQKEARSAKSFFRGIEELGRGRVERALAELEAAVKEE
jgi:hypothetical protein